MTKISQAEFIDILTAKTSQQIMKMLKILSNEYDMFEFSGDTDEIIQRVFTENTRALKKEIKNVLAETGAPRKERAKKQDIAPGAPSKPKTAYMMYCAEHRSEVKKEHPDMSNQDVTRRLSTMWKTADQSVYEKEVKEDKERFVEQMATYKSETDSDTSSLSSVETKNKRPVGPYILYLQENREKIKLAHPELKGKELTAFIGKSWKELSESKQKKYKDNAKMMMDEYKLNKK